MLPKKVFVSGMPLFLRGWNGLYEYDEDKKEYHMVNHMYYGLWIVHCCIAFDETQKWWILRTHHGHGPCVARSTSDNPCGAYVGCGSVRVDPEESLNTWWNSNSGLVAMGTPLVAAALGLVYYLA